MVHRTLMSTASLLQNMRYLMLIKMQAYMKATENIIDHSFLVPKPHLQRAWLIRELARISHVATEKKKRR